MIELSVSGFCTKEGLKSKSQDDLAVALGFLDFKEMPKQEPFMDSVKIPLNTFSKSILISVFEVCAKYNLHTNFISRQA